MNRWAVMACCVLLLGWHGRVAGQPPADDALPGAANPQATADEEAPAVLDPITVIGERTRLAVQREMYTVQSRAFKLFNELNTDDDYDIICRRERPWGSQFERRVCRARFHHEAKAQAAREYLERMETNDGVYYVNRQEINRRYEHHKELMANLANTHPEFRELLEKQYALQKEFEAMGGKVRFAIGSE